MDSNVSLIQVLLLFDEKKSEELGPTLWVTFQEVENFYNIAQTRVSCERLYLSQHVPSKVLEGMSEKERALAEHNKASFWDGLLSFIPWSQSSPKAPSEGVAGPDFSDVQKEAKGKYTRTYDAKKIGHWARKRFKIPENTRLLIITDLELTPPPDWRYLISDTIQAGTGGVVSIAQIDPLYWRISDPSRVATIKQRTRAACLSLVGEFLGLTNCENPGCFLYCNVDSVATLDQMTYLGPEHKVPSLANRGFSLSVKQEDSIQAVIENSQPEWESFSQ